MQRFLCTIGLHKWGQWTMCKEDAIYKPVLGRPQRIGWSLKQDRKCECCGLRDLKLTNHRI